MKSRGGGVHVGLATGTARWKRGTGTLQNMQMGERWRMVAGRPGQHKQQRVEASEIEMTVAELGGSLATGVVVVVRCTLTERRAQAADGRVWCECRL